MCAVFVALITTACLGAGETGEEVASVLCTPGYSELSDEVLDVPSAEYLIRFRPVLIGCKESLISLSDADRGLLREQLINLAREKKLLFLVMAENEELRRRIVEGVNEAVEGDPVSDIYFHELGFAENLHRGQ